MFNASSPVNDFKEISKFLINCVDFITRDLLPIKKMLLPGWHILAAVHQGGEHGEGLVDNTGSKPSSFFLSRSTIEII